MAACREKRHLFKSKNSGNGIKEETGDCEINCAIPGQQHEEQTCDGQKEQVYRRKSRIFVINHFG